MLPFAGAKGSGLSLIVDILAGVLTGAEFGGRVLSVMTNQERESGNGHFMLAFKVSAFLEETAYTRRIEEEIERLHRITSYNVCYTKLLRGDLEAGEK